MSESGFARRTGADYAQAFSALLPQGTAWPRDPESALMRYLSGQSGIWGDVVDVRAADLLERETDPRLTTEMLAEWERAFGLPDPCVQEPSTIEARRKVLVQRMTTEGGQSRPFFYAAAMQLGYVIRIVEYSPFMAGVSRVGDTRPSGANGEKYRWEVAPTEIRFYWTVKVFGTRLSWFRVGSGQAGVDPMLRISLAEDLECIFRAWKPAHTEIVFDYSTVTPVYYEYIPFRAGISHSGRDPLLTIIPHGGDPFTPDILPI